MKKRIKMFVLLIAILFCSILCLDITNVGVAHALSLSTNNSYTSVLEDLQKDETFNVEDYPANDKNYGFDIINIAESSMGELFLYVYQPSAKTYGIQASMVRMSTTIYDNLKNQDYTLTLLNSNGVFYKYKVDDFNVLSDAVRYYEFTALYREFDERFDKKATGENTISFVPYTVSKRFTACTINGQVSYNCIDIDVVEITAKFIGTIRYADGYGVFTNQYIDRHFVAFSCNWDIDQLFEADVSYKSVGYSATQLNITSDFIFGDWGDIKFGRSYDMPKSEVQPTTITLHSDDKHSTDGGFLASSHTWNYIEDIETFKSEQKDFLNEDALNELKGKEWVLSYYFSEFGEDTHVAFDYEWGEEVFDVTILRLKFESNGQVYNLGVVDNYQTGSQNPINDWEKDKNDWLRMIFLIVMLILLIVVLSPFLPTIINVVVAIIKTIFKILFYILSLPFKVVKGIFKKRE